MRTKGTVAAVSVTEAKRMLGGIAQATIYRLINSGKLKTFRIGKRRMISVLAIDQYIAAAEKEEAHER